MFSLTYQGAAVWVLGKLFEYAGIPFVPEDAAKAIDFLLQVVGVLVALYGRYRIGDLTWFGKRIPSDQPIA